MSWAQPVKTFWMQTPTFEQIGAEKYNIQDFTVNGATDMMTSIQVLDEQGLVKDTGYWYNEFDDDGTIYPAGWFDVSGSTEMELELEPGDGVIVNSDEKDITIQSAGQVGGAVTRELSTFKILGNPSPIAVNIQDCTVDGATDMMTSIQVLDEKGLVKDTGYWYNEFDDDGTIYPAGWFDVSGSTEMELTLQPGDSVIVNTDETGVTMTFPAAL